MPVKSFKPFTPTRRFQTVEDRSDVTRQTPERSLTEGKKRTGGRNNYGRLAMRFRGGGAKRALRDIDFKRDKHGIGAVVASIEYDPNRSARIALLNYADGEKRYIIAPLGLKVGQAVASGPDVDILVGNAPPAQEHSSRHDCPLHRTAAWQRCADGAIGGSASQPRVSRNRVRLVEAAFGRSPAGQSRVSGHDRSSRQSRSRECHAGQSRTHSSPGPETS